MTDIGYARVSTVDQDPELQVRALVAAGVDPDRIYVDHASGATTSRPELDQCLRALREGDTLVVWKLDRLGRSMPHLVKLLNQFRERGVQFRSLTEGIDTTTAMGEMMFHFLAAIAQFERSLIRERTMAGLAAARANGRQGGRPCTVTPKMARQARQSLEIPGATVAAVARSLGVTRQALYRALAQT